MTFRKLLTGVLLVVLSLICGLAVATTDWISEMPKPADVLAGIQGSDAYDTAARQYAAMQILIRIRGDMVGDRAFRNQATPEEKALATAYSGESTRIQSALIESLPADQRTGKDSLRAKWFSLASKYQYDPAFREALVDKYFSKRFQAALGSQETKAAAQAKAGAEMLQPPPTTVGNAAGAGATSGPREFVERLVPAPWHWAVNPWLWTAVFAALFAFGVARSVAPFGLATGDAFALQVGARRYQLHHAVGLVTDLQRWGSAVSVPTSQTVTHSDGSQSTVHGSTTRVSNRIQIMLRDAAGRTQDIQLADVELAVAPGQGFAAVWAIRKGGESGPYVILHNHDLGRTQFMAAVSDVVKMPMWPAFALGAAVLFVGLPWWAALAALVGWGVAVGVLNGKRQRRFESEFATRILAALPKPPEGIALPGGGMLSPG